MTRNHTVIGILRKFRPESRAHMVARIKRENREMAQRNMSENVLRQGEYGYDNRYWH